MEFELERYFETASGIGVLSTAGRDGTVNSAVYARPRVIDRTTVAFLVGFRETREHLFENPHASYLFIESGEGFRGVRLNLSWAGEDTDQAAVHALLRQRGEQHFERYRDVPATVVRFRVDRLRPLVGDAGPGAG